jgi:hypothetical protein
MPDMVKIIGKRTALANVSSRKTNNPVFKLMSFLARAASLLVIPIPNKSKGRTINVKININSSVTTMIDWNASMDR